MDMKKGLLIGAVVVVVLGILVAVYFVFFSKPPSLSVDETPNPFGEAPDTPPTTSDDSNDPFALGQAGQTIAPRFIKITDGPVARGSVVFQTAFVNEQVSVEASTTLESVPEKDYTNEHFLAFQTARFRAFRKPRGFQTALLCMYATLQNLGGDENKLKPTHSL
jgi:hypothetical protein